MNQNYKDYLDSIAKGYDPSTSTKDFDWWLLKFDFKVLQNYLIGDTVIELGCGRGVITLKLARIVKNKLMVVEGSKENINYMKNLISDNPKVEFYHSLWQEFDCKEIVSDVVFFSGLEHLSEQDGEIVLSNIKNWLNKHSRLHIIVPNVRSIHRRIAWYGGLISDVFEFSERDKQLGHKTLYDKEKLFTLLKKVGYKILSWQGVFLKPFPNSTMMQLNLSEEVLNGLFEMGREIPEYCSHIYVCCKVKRCQDKVKL